MFLINFYLLFFQQSQALALTHKASPPSRPSSEPSLPRSPQSSSSSVTAITGQHTTNNQTSQNSHQQSQLISTIHTQSQSSQQKQSSQHSPINITHSTPYAAHGQHLKQEINSNTKQEGFDLSKTTSGTGKFIFFKNLLCYVISIY